MSAFNFSTCSGLTRAEKVTLPDGLRPAPLRFPPREYKTTFRGSPSRKFLLLTLVIFVFILEFPAQQASRASGMVADFVGIAEHRTLGTDTAQFHHVFDKMFGGFNFDVPQHCATGVSGWWMESNGSVKQIKCGESDWLTAVSLKKPFPAVDNRSHGDLVCGVAVSVADAPTGMNLAVKSDFRKSMLKPVGSVNHSTFARPEIFTVPHGAAAIELFRSPPADERGLAKPINRKSHLCFINHELNNNSTIKRSQA